MNPELQKSLQVSVMPGSLDSHMLIVLLIMVAAGLLGGVANCYLSDRQGDAGRREEGTARLAETLGILRIPIGCVHRHRCSPYAQSKGIRLQRHSGEAHEGVGKDRPTLFSPTTPRISRPKEHGFS